MPLAEIVEYTLVVLVSALFVGGSVATYDSFSSFTSGLQLRLDSASVAKLADEAVTNGSAAMTLTVPPSTLTCQGGVLSLTSSGFSQSHAVSAGCDFRFSLHGVQTLRFAYRSSQLTLAVS
jgi:hypothetical protein